MNYHDMMIALEGAVQATEWCMSHVKGTEHEKAFQSYLCDLKSQYVAARWNALVDLYVTTEVSERIN